MYKKCWESSSKYRTLVQPETCSQERIAALSNPIARNRLVRQSTCDLHRESGWCAGKLEKNYIPKSTNHHEYRVSSSSRTRNIKVDVIFLKKKMRDNLPTGKAKGTCRTGKPVAVPWIAGFKVYHKLQSEKKTHIVMRSSRS